MDLKKQAASKQQPSARSTPTHGPCSTNTGPTCHAMKTCEPSRPNSSQQMELMLTSSPEGSPVRTSAPQEKEQALPENAAVSGQRSPDLLASYDRATSSWRTSQSYVDGGFQRYSETFPRSGMMRSGTAFLLPTLVRLTAGTASGSSRTQQDGTRTMWPTPGAGDHRDRGHLSQPCIQRRVSMGKQLNLSMVVSLTSGALNPTWVEWLMGYPDGWTDLSASETPSSPRSRR